MEQFKTRNCDKLEKDCRLFSVVIKSDTNSLLEENHGT